MISILIPCHNSERWIGEAIDSALAQTWGDVEVVVVDDGSTDSSRTVIGGFGDRVRYEVQDNQGGGATRQRLLELSRGDWLQYLDADDLLLEDKVEKQATYLAERDDVDVLYGPVVLQDEPAGPPSRRVLEIPEPHDPWVLLARWYLPQTGSPLWRKSALEEVGGWKPDQKVCQEHELYLRLLKAGKRFEYYGEAGAVYRLWGDSTVSRHAPSETIRVRLGITAEAESWLERSGPLDALRRGAIALSRLEMARSEWPRDRDQALEIAAGARRAHPGFVPHGPAFPILYRLLYRFLGFRIAETIAGWKRAVLGRWGRGQSK